MDNQKELGGEVRPSREPFITIDDLTTKAEELTAGLRKLRENRYPLDVRKGAILKEQAGNTSDASDSKTIKAGTKTYFFDIKQSRNGELYLAITESRFRGERKKRERNTITIFSEQAEAFVTAVIGMISKLN